MGVPVLTLASATVTHAVEGQRPEHTAPGERDADPPDAGVEDKPRRASRFLAKTRRDAALTHRARRGDRAEIGKPFRFGEETALIEMPISWSLDDYPHFEFVRTPTVVLPGLQSARTVMESWRDEFRYMQQTVDWGVLTYTMHPYVIGRGYRMLALEALVKDLAAAGAVFMVMEDAAAEAQARMFGETAP